MHVLAECAGYLSHQSCDTICNCDNIYDPVCLISADGEVLQFANQCEAACRGYPDADPCDTCLCPAYFAPVCAVSAAGDIIQFDNPCLAECAGYTDFVQCCDGCGCEAIVDPVCVVLDDGTSQEYMSACAAICDGFNVFYNCATLCSCAQIVDPVCINLADGITQAFLNPCLAHCAGYEVFDACAIVEGNEPTGEINFEIQAPSIEVRSDPNPFTNQLVLGAKKKGRDEVHVNVFDLLGHSIFSEIITLPDANFWSSTIDASSWPRGTYLLRISEGTYPVKTKKLIKH